jgi:hypothetical protein
VAQTGSHVDAQRTSTIVARPLDLGATCDLGRQRRTVADAVAAAEGSTWRGAAAREARILRSKPPAAAETRIPRTIYQWFIPAIPAVVSAADAAIAPTGHIRSNRLDLIDRSKSNCGRSSASWQLTSEI